MGSLDDSRYLSRLGVNVDHVATLRQNRGTKYPDPVTAARLAEDAGAHQITVHLREDRRHVQDCDLEILRKIVQTRLNLEMAATPEMVRIALRVRPNQVTLVPERRQELTTEGGLAVASQERRLAGIVKKLKRAGIAVSMFIEPDRKQIEASAEVGAFAVELHTGRYANSPTRRETIRQLDRIGMAARDARSVGLRVYAGHGLHYQNTRPVAELPEIEELNIGHSIVARALFVGIGVAVREMLELLERHPQAPAEAPFPPTYKAMS